MAWTWSLQAAFGTKLPTEVWDHITAFADPREQSVSMPSAPTTSPKSHWLSHSKQVCQTKSFYSSKHVCAFIFESHARRNGDSSLQARLVLGMVITNTIFASMSGGCGE